MQLYITYGTINYLTAIIPPLTGTALLLENSEEAVAIIETEQSNPFKEGTAYTVLNAKGELTSGGFAIVNHIPVTDEGRPLFEDRFSQRAGLVEKEPGFQAIRVLRPIGNDPYIVLTLWATEQDFTNWQESSAYKEAHKNRNTGKGLPQTLFSGPSYVKRFSVKK